jgi:ATP-dependent DNA helicase RecG
MHAVLQGKISSSKVIFGNKRQLHVYLEDPSGSVLLVFFYFNKAQQANLKPGNILRCHGEIRLWQKKIAIIHPEYQLLKDAQVTPVAEALTPVYPSTEGWHQKRWQALIEQALARLRTKNLSLEIIPEHIRAQFNLSPIETCLEYLHCPPPDADRQLLEIGMHPFQQRLAFEELLAQQLSLRKLRQRIQQHQAPILPVTEMYHDNFLQQLPFKLTHAQQLAQQEINADLQQPKPMLRLVQGDVGSGKTVIAALAALNAIGSNYQAAIMAPTELLAEQHYHQFINWFTPLGIKVAWLAGKLRKKDREKMLAMIASGEARLVVGTHALFQADVEFANLALVVIDEQHRFGVEQRLALRSKGTQENSYPHQLIMTATPIPRTLAMTVYADLDLSIINELPPGRTPIQTIIVNNNRREEIIAKVHKRSLAGEQTYWVCPLIEESETLECMTVEDLAEQLHLALPDVNTATVHGRLATSEKQHIMEQFQQGTIQVLVATTVIEVGINVPNATLMIIENAERLGLSQLHQLRGRVGRGVKESHCVLLYQSPLSELAKSRLAVMRDSVDGFYIAEQDLKLRGAGEFFGTKQTGMQRLKIADVMRDRQLLPLVRQAASLILKTVPDVADPIIQRWLKQSEEFAHV